MRKKAFSRLLFILFIFSIPLVSRAQDRANYKLLWEIEHKDSKKKSYIFGTIHLKDKRVFNFSDAVIPAIRNTESFALEVHPDSLSDGLTNNLLNTEVENIYRKVLSEEEYERLDRRYREVKGEPLDSARFKNPVMIESVLMEDIEKQDDKRTFLDGYLYGIAYSLDKKIYGLEKLEDQMPNIEDISEEEIRTNILSMLDSEEESMNNYIEEMVELYYKGNIDEIFLRSVGLFTVDQILNDRNHVMANSIEKVMATNSIFAAVGAAHLPGNEGIVEILRRKGFKVNPVEATFENESEEFEIKPNLNKWHTDDRPELGFKVMTPNQAVPWEYNENLDFMMSTDLMFGGVFGYMAIDLGRRVLNEGFDYVENVIQRQTNGNAENIIDRKSYEKDGVAFTELTLLSNEGYGRILLANANRIVYYFIAQNDLEELHTPYVDAFFDSIEITPPQVAATQWVPFNDTNGAFTVNLPSDMKDVSREVENPNGEILEPYKLKIFAAEDPENEMVYVLRYNNLPLGFYMQDQDQHETYFANYFNERGTVIGDPREFKIGDYIGQEYELLLSDKYHTYARVFLRGNRTYVMLAQKSVTEKKVNRDNPFFSSFDLTEYQPKLFDSIVNIDNRYSFKMSGEIVKKVDSSGSFANEYDTNTHYMGLQEATGGMYGLVHTTYKPYFRVENLDKLYDQYAQTLLEPGDTLVLNRDITIAGKPAREILIQNNVSHVRERMKMLLDNESLFLLQVYASDEEINTPFAEDFLNSFRILNSKRTFDPFASKTKMIMKDLSSKDSLTYEKANEAIDYYDFRPEDSKAMIKALSETYPFDLNYNTSKRALLGALLETGEKGILNKVVTYYNKEDTPANLRVYILQQLFKLEEPDTELTYFNLVENSKPKRDSDAIYDIFAGFRDSIPLVIKNQERLAALLKEDDYRDQVVSFYEYHLRTNSTALAKLSTLGNEINGYMSNDIRNYADTLQRNSKPNLNYTLIDDYINIIRHRNDKSEFSQNIIRQIYNEVEPTLWLRTSAIILAIELGFEVDEALVNENLDDIYSRYEIMEALVKGENKNRIPLKFLEAEAFSKLSLYNAIGADDGYPDIMNKLGSFTYDGITFIAYAFGYSNDVDDYRYLGAVVYKAGDPDTLKANESYWTWEDLETDWQTQAIKMLKVQRGQ